MRFLGEFLGGRVTWDASAMFPLRLTIRKHLPVCTAEEFCQVRDLIERRVKQMLAEQI